jgi:hypothetical protein
LRRHDGLALIIPKRYCLRALLRMGRIVQPFLFKVSFTQTAEAADPAVF